VDLLGITERAIAGSVEGSGMPSGHRTPRHLEPVRTVSAQSFVAMGWG